MKQALHAHDHRVNTPASVRPEQPHRLFALLAIFCFACSLLATPQASAQGRGVEYFLTGSGADAGSLNPPTSTAAVLMGGGTDVDAAFQWMIQKAGGGDFLVLRSSGSNGYNAYIYAMGGLDSVETLVVKSRQGAADPFVIDRIQRAEAIFIAGGDQSEYIRLWKGTPLHAALEQAISRKVPVGGTSAGLAILGAVDYAASNGSVTSSQALANPYNRDMTLDSGFVTAPGMVGTVLDSHFQARDRMGRLMSFVARMMQDGLTTLTATRAIGVDEATALVLDNGVATRLGSGSAWFLRPGALPAVCQSRRPLTLRGVSVERMSGGGSFDLNSWSGIGTTRYELAAENGALLSSQSGGGIY